MATTTAAAGTRTTEGPTWALDPPAGPRYDGLADWYDAEVRRLPLTATAAGALLRLLGPGPGRCLDLACDTGLTLRRIEEPGEDDYPFLLALVLER